MGVERLQGALRTPRMFEKVKPCGCAEAPVAAQLIGEEEKRVLANGSSAEKKHVAGELWVKLAGCVEAELCGVLDLVPKEGLIQGGVAEGLGAGRCRGKCCLEEPAVS